MEKFQAHNKDTGSIKMCWKESKFVIGVKWCKSFKKKREEKSFD